MNSWVCRCDSSVSTLEYFPEEAVVDGAWVYWESASCILELLCVRRYDSLCSNHLSHSEISLIVRTKEGGMIGEIVVLDFC